MHETTDNNRRRAVVLLADAGEYDVERSLDELRELSDTAEIDIVGEVVQRLSAPDKATYLGSGKLAEARELCETLDADLMIADTELTAVQLRNIEQAADIDVIDRTMLILDIFAANAVTAQGKLQVERAQLYYRLPRLASAGKALSRLGGGIGTRGPGESKLESDRRHIRRRIAALDEQLELIAVRRETTRKKREKSAVPIVALVGYTNVGKSSLLNALTDADVLAEDRLFATLDTTMRRLSVGNLQQVLMVDTVGFVSRLPHHLVEAFKSTLEEIKYADLIVKVADASDPAWPSQLEVTDGIIESLNCSDIPSLLVFNKADLVPAAELPALAVSAKTRQGLDSLIGEISRQLEDRVVLCRLLFPFAKIGMCAGLRESGNIRSEEYTDGGLLVVATVPRERYPIYREFVLDGK